MAAISFNNGTSLLIPYDKEEVDKFVNDPDVKKVQIFKEGEVIELSDRKYKVNSRGSFERIRT